MGLSISWEVVLFFALGMALLYGVGCGLLTVFIRRFGPAAEGVSFSILIMNLLVWFIDRATMPRRFGEER